MTTEPRADDMWNTVRAFWPARILLTAVELDIFAIIGEGRSSTGEVAKSARTDRRATELLLNALVAMGYLKKEGKRYENGEVARLHLVKGLPGYLGGALNHSNYLWMTWSHLTEVVRSGKPAEEEGPAGATEHFIMAMHARAREDAGSIARMIDFTGVRKMLDLGGGPGTYAIEFARRNAGLEAVVFDRVDVVPIAQGIVAEAGIEGQVETMAGNFLKDDIGSGYDLVLVSAIIHSYGPRQNRLILGKVYEALNPGGQVVIRDFIMDERKTEPASGALFAINMLVNTDEGATWSEGEVREWLEGCGFGDITRKDDGSGSPLIIATKR